MSTRAALVRYAVPTSLFAAWAVALTAAACGGSDLTSPGGPFPESFQLSGPQVGSLDSTGQVIVQANPGNADLKSLVDSTLGALTAGVTATHIAVTTNLTSVPLHFVGIHRVFNVASAFSTWAVVGFDDPSHLVNLLEVSGFAQSGNATAPASVSADIGSGSVNALMLQTAAGGAITEWFANSGTASFGSDAPGAACPGFTATPTVTCALETMHVHFAFSAA
ncbi:MAG TPA: hypothetical protein VII52_06735, partial [Gemmatimonadaceae bacterium]